MNILWLSWKDKEHPEAGGAETVSSELMARLVEDGHSVRLITARYPGSKPQATIDGVKVFRVGGRYSVYLKANLLFRKQMRSWPELVIDEMNTIPFGTAFYNNTRTVLFTYQLARSVWFYQMAFPFSLIGYILEPVYLWIMSRRYGEVLTESESTRSDLTKFGFNKDSIHIVRIGMHTEPLKSLPIKRSRQNVLFLGSFRPMKRTLDAIKAFEVAKDKNAALKLTLAGDDSGKYGSKVRKYANNSRHANAIKILGRVSNDQRLDLMKGAGIILVTSVKEGWGLIVTEANSQGTPAIAYSTDGLRDSVHGGKTGVLVKSGDYEAMGNEIAGLVNDPKRYDEYRELGWKLSKQFSFDNSYKDFLKNVGL